MLPHRKALSAGRARWRSQKRDPITGRWIDESFGPGHGDLARIPHPEFNASKIDDLRRKYNSATILGSDKHKLNQKLNLAEEAYLNGENEEGDYLVRTAEDDHHEYLNNFYAQKLLTEYSASQVEANAQVEPAVFIPKIPKPDLETMVEAFRNEKPASGSNNTWHSIMSPLRRSEDATDQIATVYQATGGDVKATMKVLDSQTRWQGGWATATDEWAAMESLGGSGFMHKNTRIALDGDPNEVLGRAREVEPLSDVEIAGFRARQKWHQDKFRELYPEGLEVYRGVTGKTARKPYLDAIGDYQSERDRVGAEHQRRVEETGDYGRARPVVESGPVPAPQYGLASWTKNRFEASEFAYGVKGNKAGVIIKTKITADDIWMFPRLGVESPFRIVDAAAEVVLLNRDQERISNVVSD